VIGGGWSGYRTRGIYILLISVEEPITVRVGSLGDLAFKIGTYAYVGSAQNNLERRIARHLKSDKRIFWHIDYLLSNKCARILEVFFKVAPKTEECRTAEMLGEAGESIEGFGSSDCKCASHLFKVSNYGRLKRLIENMNFVRMDLERLMWAWNQ